MPSVIPQPGGVAHVRSRRYLIESVALPEAPARDTLVRLSCIDDDALGSELQVLWEREVDAWVEEQSGWNHLGERGFDAPGLFSAYLNTIRWNSVSATDPSLFQAPFRAGIEVTAYQLEPLRKALQLPRVNLFIADDVGLGKTIEAGLIVRELMLRQRVQRVVVAAPPSVVPQWKDEMEARFGLTFEVYNREFVRTKRVERGHGVNPWSTHSRFIISHALLRDPAYTSGLADWLGESSYGTLFILDEAHHAAPAGSSRYAIDSHFTRAIRDLASRFEHRLFLSATPHNGHSNSFAALLELLDPQRFTRGVPVKSAKELDAIMVRRLKEDLRRLRGGFPVRHVPAITIDGLPADAPELVLAEKLDELRTVRTQRLGAERKTAQSAGQLTIINLQKRLWSSIEAFARTLAIHQRTLERLAAGAQPAPVTDASVHTLALALAPAGADSDSGDLSEEEQDAAADAAMERVTEVAGGSASPLLDREIALVREMRAIADAHRYSPDSRLQRLIDWIRTNQCPELPPLGEPPQDTPAWLPRRLIIFTEYADTKRHLEQQLRSAIAGTDGEQERIATYHGGMNEDAREEVKRAFNEDPARNPLRILIATDAAREGLNLQQYCADLFHFDLPWNPARLEQRNGRIDRKGQPAAEVRCHYFVLAQRPEDRVLDTLVRKTETIREQLGSLAPVLQRDVEALLSSGITRDRAAQLQREIETADLDATRKATVLEQLEAARERNENLERQLDQLQSLRAKAQDHLNFREPAFRSALNRALAMKQLPPLQLIPGSDPPRWRVNLPTHDPAWADTIDTLRPKKPRTTTRDEWREQSEMRPIVFSDDGRLDSDVVQLHLEHRLVQRLLGQFTAQGLVHFDLARACIGQTRDSQPRVILLGRIGLFGPRAGRLHDEIVMVGARWRPLASRRAALEPYSEGGRAEATTLDLLYASLPEADDHPVPAEVQSRLKETAPRDVEDLRPHLETRARAAEELAAQQLSVRADKEASDLERLIRERVTRIRAMQAESPQLELLLATEDERRQLRSEQRHWTTRIESLERELTSEPARVKESYSVKSSRLEPIGIVYLWPASG